MISKDYTILLLYMENLLQKETVKDELKKGRWLLLSRDVSAKNIYLNNLYEEIFSNLELSNHHGYPVGLESYTIHDEGQVDSVGYAHVVLVEVGVMAYVLEMEEMVVDEVALQGHVEVDGVNEKVDQKEGEVLEREEQEEEHLPQNNFI